MIRKPSAWTDDAPSGDEAAEDPTGRVSLEATSISFARAIDQVCRQANYRWLLVLDPGERPILQIEAREEAEQPSEPAEEARKLDMNDPVKGIFWSLSGMKP